MLAYVEEDPTWQAVVGLRKLLRTLYSPVLVMQRPSCRLVAAAFREHCCGGRRRTIGCSSKQIVPAAHWWLSGNVKLGLNWGLVVPCDVFVLVCCAFCMLGNVHLLFLEVLDTHLVKVQRWG